MFIASLFTIAKGTTQNKIEKKKERKKEKRDTMAKEFLL